MTEQARMHIHLFIHLINSGICGAPALRAGEGMATHSSVLVWRIPGMGEPGGLQSMGLCGVGHDCHDLAAAAAALRVVGGILNKGDRIFAPRKLHSGGDLSLKK